MQQSIDTKQSALSLERLVLDYGSMVSAVCRRMIQDRENAQEAAQEIWLQVLESLPSFQGKSKISTWLYSIACRVAMHYARKERLYSTRYLRDYFRSGERDFPEDDDIDRRAWVKELCDKCLTGILHCLNNEARIAYIFRDVIQLSYPDISQILEKDSSAVRQLVSRSRRKLKRFLENECALQNPDGKCACQMKKLVLQVNLPREYQKLEHMVTRANLFKKSEQVLPGKNFWEKYL